MEESKRVGNNELYNLLVSRELSWQQIIHDLINSEQLDPWDIDLSILTQKYLEKIRELEANFFISSKVLLAAAILLRIKSEMLKDRYIRSLDDILFGREDEKKEKIPINIDLSEVTDLIPRTPMPRMKKVTLPELMAALNRAIMTEHRRIKKEIAIRHATTRLDLLLPKKKTNIRYKIVEVYQKILKFFSKKEDEKMTYSQLTNNEREEKISSFMPILHLDTQEKIVLEQLQSFDEIYIYMKSRHMSEEELTKKISEQQEKINKLKNGDGMIDDNLANEKGIVPEEQTNEEN